jgi:hypothetical protein
MDVAQSTPGYEALRIPPATAIPTAPTATISSNAIFLSRQFSKVTRPLGRWAGVKLHTLLVCIVALTLPFHDPGVTLLVGGFLVAPAFVAFGFLEARRAPLWFSPLSFYFFWNAIGLGLSAIYLSWRVFSGLEIPFSVTLIPAEDAAAGYVIYLLGSLVVHIGLQWTRPVSQQCDFTTPAVPEKHAFQWLVGLWVLGLIYQWKPAWFGFLGTMAKPLQWATLAGLAIFFILPREQFGFSREAKAVLGVMGTAIAVVGNARSGSKAYIMFAFLPLLWVMVLRPRIRRWLPAAAVAMALIYFFAVEPFITTQRMRNQVPQDSETSSAETFLMRQADSVPTAYFLGEVRARGFMLGQTMDYAKYAFIPRLFWPDKPNVSRGAWFTSYLGFSPREEEATTSTGITATGELYWNYGLWGVVFGNLLLGAGYGLLWRMAGKNPVAQPLHMLLYVLVTFEGMTDMPEAVTVYTAQVSMLLLFGWIFLILKSQRWMPDYSLTRAKFWAIATRR